MRGVGLVLVREEGVHGVPGLVGQGRDFLVEPREVLQLVRVHPVGPGGVGAGFLAGGGHEVHPALLVAFLEGPPRTAGLRARRPLGQGPWPPPACSATSPP